MKPQEATQQIRSQLVLQSSVMGFEGFSSCGLCVNLLVVSRERGNIAYTVPIQYIPIFPITHQKVKVSTVKDLWLFPKIGGPNIDP